MVISMQSKVDAAIKDIRRFHATGRKSLREHGPRVAKEQIEADAQKLGLNPNDLQKARQFAGEKGYTGPELEELCSQIKGQEKRDDIASIFSFSHVRLLLPIHRKEERLKLQEDAITGGWTVKKLELAIAARFDEKEKGGGRRPSIPDNLDGVYAQIKRMCFSWQRWIEDLSVMSKKPKSKLAQMRPEIWAAVHKVEKRLGELGDLVSRALPSRKEKSSEKAGATNSVRK